MIMKRWWNDTDRGDKNYLEKNLSKCHYFAHWKSLGICGEWPLFNWL